MNSALNLIEIKEKQAPAAIKKQKAFGECLLCDDPL